MDNKKTCIAEFAIVDGPSRDLLFDCLKYAFDKNQKVLATFKVRNAKEGSDEVLVCKLLALEHESGDLDSFILRGYYCRNHSIKEWNKFEAFYSSRKRNGNLKLVMG